MFPAFAAWPRHDHGLLCLSVCLSLPLCMYVYMYIYIYINIYIYIYTMVVHLCWECRCVRTLSVCDATPAAYGIYANHCILCICSILCQITLFCIYICYIYIYIYITYDYVILCIYIYIYIHIILC